LIFIKENIDKIHEEEVEEYSQALGQLFKWLKTAIELRIENVKQRRMLKKQEREARQDAIERETERNERLQAIIEEKKEEFEARMQHERDERARAMEEDGDDAE
jgi:Asp-tRNA(Asn)/Glu-tRNA(Gln) amidotransferase C subunit